MFFELAFLTSIEVVAFQGPGAQKAINISIGYFEATRGYVIYSPRAYSTWTRLIWEIIDNSER